MDLELEGSGRTRRDGAIDFAARSGGLDVGIFQALGYTVTVVRRWSLQSPWPGYVYGFAFCSPIDRPTYSLRHGVEEASRRLELSGTAAPVFGVDFVLYPARLLLAWAERPLTPGPAELREFMLRAGTRRGASLSAKIRRNTPRAARQIARAVALRDRPVLAETERPVDDGVEREIS